MDFLPIVLPIFLSLNVRCHKYWQCVIEPFKGRHQKAEMFANAMSKMHASCHNPGSKGICSSPSDSREKS